MLKSTFCHLKGVGEKTERGLWQKGITTWDKYRCLVGEQLSIIDNAKSDHVLLDSLRALESGDAGYFSERLSPGDYYRIALTYPKETIFLDIETTGLSLFYDQLTMVGWSMGQEFNVYVYGQDDMPLRAALKTAKVIVTFNGTIFDLKFLHKTFKDLCVPLVHLDLRYFSKRVGFSGGQKKIEQQIGFKRTEKLEGMLGESAPVLWHQYRRGDNKALKKLIEYNHADVEGMKAILDESIKKYYTQKKVPLNIRVKGKFSNKKSKIKWARNKPSDNDSDKIFIEGFNGSVKPLITYSDLNSIFPLDRICVIGIDLVSSEERETGCCVLKGNIAETSRLKTDDELIQLAIDRGVNLVSIDSPLSIPKGRTSYFDDDPHRHEFGITRLCERILKKRGINSYPCLIPSMQKLTQRGMELTKKFRKLGIPVIESYPGAAQDIMSIPRKQAGLQYLTEGIAEFGIEGEFIKMQVSHDELDAVTSAIVGHFYWTGMYERLGDEEEDYLIIPDLNANTSKWLQRRVVGLSGEIEAWKTKIVNYFKTKGYGDTGYSKVLESMLVAEGKNVNGSSLQEICTCVNAEKGQRWLGYKVAESIEGEMLAVINGVRFLEDMSFLTEFFGPAYIHIHVKRKKDFHSDRVSNGSDGNILLEETVKSKTRSEIALLEKVADVVIEDNGSMEMLYEKLDNIVGEN
ncbi:MAG: ribonuclease H-like domain-containing protein [Pseudomonadota bacterium]